MSIINIDLLADTIEIDEITSVILMNIEQGLRLYTIFSFLKAFTFRKVSFTITTQFDFIISFHLTLF